MQFLQDKKYQKKNSHFLILIYFAFCFQLQPKHTLCSALAICCAGPVMKWWSKRISMAIAKTTSRSLAFKVAKMRESIMEDQDELLMRKSKCEEVGWKLTLSFGQRRMMKL